MQFATSITTDGDQARGCIVSNMPAPGAAQQRIDEPGGVGNQLAGTDPLVETARLARARLLEGGLEGV